MTKKQLFRLNKVICEEKFVFEDEEIAVPINLTSSTDLPQDSKIDSKNSKTSVTVQSCKVETIDDGCKKIFIVKIEFFIIKKIVIIRPGMKPLTLEFSFIKEFSQRLKTCKPKKLSPSELRKLKCKVWDFKISDKAILNPNNQTFDDLLIIKGIVKVETEVQIPLKVKKREICQAELAVAIGKIRQVIPTGRFKTDLVGRLIQVSELLNDGLITESLTVISTIIEKLQLEINRGGGNQTKINLAIGDLLRLKQCLLDFLEKRSDCRCADEWEKDEEEWE